MNKIRLLYSKTGNARYISHLDLMATMRRALLRAGVGLKYSEGFNPHPYISVALPLSVGNESFCELLDFTTNNELLPDGLPELINPGMPDGLMIREAYVSERKFVDISWIRICCMLDYETNAPPEATGILTELFKAESIVINKKTKRGLSEIDIAPFIKQAKFSFSGIVKMNALVSAQNPSVSAEDVKNAIRAAGESQTPDFLSFTREEILDKDMAVFR